MKKKKAHRVLRHTFERVNNGLPGQTVKGRGCNMEEEGCL
ncbi:hypothetical protein EVA_22400, partial [gut metagenome]